VEKVVDDEDIVTGRLQLDDRVGADVAGAACNEDAFGRSSES
jgi:hypothetical protein